jgi:hypothetical protein
MGAIKNLFSGLFSIVVFIIKLPFTLFTLPAKLLAAGEGLSSAPAKKKSSAPAKKKSSAPAKKKSNGAFYLEMEDAKGFVETAPKAEASKKAKAPESAVPVAASNGSALNLPQPTVTTTASASEADYSQFGPRRGPGANMKSFLDMAKTVKNA